MFGNRVGGQGHALAGHQDARTRGDEDGRPGVLRCLRAGDGMRRRRRRQIRKVVGFGRAPLGARREAGDELLDVGEEAVVADVGPRPEPRAELAVHAVEEALGVVHLVEDRRRDLGQAELDDDLEPVEYSSTDVAR